MRLEFITSTYHSIIFETPGCGLYSRLCIYVSIYLCINVSMYLCIYVSMYPYSSLSTHGISGLAAGGA